MATIPIDENQNGIADQDEIDAARLRMEPLGSHDGRK